MGVFFLEETLPRDQRQPSRSAIEPAEGRTCKSRARPWDSLHTLPRGLIKMIAGYCVLSAYAAAWIQNFVLVVSLPRKINGFALGPHEIGLLQNCAAAGLLITQLCLYPCLT